MAERDTPLFSSLIAHQVPYLLPMRYSCERGNALTLECGKRTLTPHIVNNRGGWGAGFVVAISAISKLPEERYRTWSSSGTMALGLVQPVTVSKEWSVLNMCAQNGYKTQANPVPMDIDALKTCLSKAGQVAQGFDIVQMPKIGCGLGGGEWYDVEPLIIAAFAKFGGEVRIRFT